MWKKKCIRAGEKVRDSVDVSTCILRLMLFNCISNLVPERIYSFVWIEKVSNQLLEILGKSKVVVTKTTPLKLQVL